jgi:small nuclear ribonucleoprotein D3
VQVKKTGCSQLRLGRVNIQMASVGVPVKLLKEAEAHVITVELKNGDTYNGTLNSVDRFMNIKMSDVVQTNKNGD